MKKAIVKFILVFVVLTALFMVQKPVFMGVYADRIAPGWPDWLTVPLHGLPMDLCMAGYLTVVPGLLIAAQLLTARRWPRVALQVWLGIVAALISAVFCLDIVLYGYWGFRLDMTPFFYFATSPSAAMASVAWWQALAGAVGFLAVGVLVWWIMRVTIDRVEVTPVKSWSPVAVILFMTALLILPIRGSVTVSTMNPSRAYFSHNRGLNHAATNPMFNLLYSAGHQSDFGTRYRFFNDADAAALFAQTVGETPGQPAEAGTVAANEVAAPVSVAGRPDVYVLLLESFSAHLMPVLGGEAVATGLDSIARHGMLFTSMYANSFRTDRALPSVFSALPGQPSASILKYVDKIERLPSFPREMKEQAGYTTAYYYGGDTNFTNMQAYLMAMGVDRVVSDRDFPLSQKASKWGAPDGPLFSRAADDLGLGSGAASQGAAPRLTVIQTSSSHEPFEVPYRSARWGAIPQANAFAYTDSCLTAFVNRLRDSGRWNRSLVVIVPDHYGCWPQNLPTMPERHHIPLVITGGALEGAVPAQVDTPSTQADIAATLLGLLGLDAGRFPFSRDLLSGRPVPPIAVFTESGGLCAVTPEGFVELDPDADRVTAVSGLDAASAATAADRARAWLQTLYGYIDRL